MDSNRRYTEAEVEEILRRATNVSEASDRSLASFEGMTLAELQDIAGEVGIDPLQVSRAATALDRREATPSLTRTFMGAKIGVGRTAQFDRRLTQEEWHRLVLDLRDTFDAKGKVREEGSFREWTNGNLQALLEPTDTGERLRLKTVKGDAKPALVGGLTMAGVFSVLLILGTLSGSFTDPTNLFWILAGGALFAVQRIRLPRWAETRELQMEGIVARLTAGMESAEGPAAENE
jgi:hypothetical protein